MQTLIRPSTNGHVAYTPLPEPASHKVSEPPTINGSMSAAIREEILSYMRSRKTHKVTKIYAHCDQFGWSHGLISYVLSNLCKQGKIYRTKWGVYSLQPKKSYKVAKIVNIPTPEENPITKQMVEDNYKNEQINAAVAQHTENKMWKLERMVINTILDKIASSVDFSAAELELLKEKLLV